MCLYFDKINEIDKKLLLYEHNDNNNFLWKQGYRDYYLNDFPEYSIFPR